MFEGRDINLRTKGSLRVASSTERIRVKLPPGFDPSRHMSPLMKKITDTNGEG